jgi:hypothetical protein
MSWYFTKMAPIPTYNPVKEIKAGGSSREVAVVIK